MRQPVQVLVYPVRRSGHGLEFLLLHRIPARGAFWQGVTGGVKEGEGLDEAAKRELVEETGFTSSKLQRIEYSYSFPVEDKWRRIYGYDDGVKEIMEYVFVAFIDDEKPRIDPHEHDQWKWCGFEEALRLLSWPNNIEALKRCHDAAKS